MRNTIKNDISVFFGRLSMFHDQISHLGAQGNTNQTLLKLGYMTLLDSVSRIAPVDPILKSNGNRSRVLSLLFFPNVWENALCISIPLLFSEKSSQEKMGNQFHYRRFQAVALNAPVTCNVDYFDRKYEDLPDDYFGGLQSDRSVALRKFSHAARFYDARNSLIHEFNSANDRERPNQDEPFYHKISNSAKRRSSKYEIVYPLRFYRKISLAGINEMKNYCLSNVFSPYDKL